LLPGGKQLIYTSAKSATAAFRARLSNLGDSIARSTIADILTLGTDRGRRLFHCGSVNRARLQRFVVLFFIELSTRR
jgi:hypothetical protein